MANLNKNKQTNNNSIRFYVIRKQYQNVLRQERLTELMKNKQNNLWPKI